MKVSLNWLTDYVDISMSAKELAEALTAAGLSCEEIVETDSDVILDLEVTSNRPDWNGHLGVAREIAAIAGAEFRPPSIGELPTSGKASELTSVTVEDPDLCARYTARVIRNVRIGPSPRWMIERLEATGLRGINNVVDATNYVLMEYSQPLHSFDYDKLAGHRIVVRRARQGEVLVSIDETTCPLDERMLVIADAEKPVAIAGVMGGLNTEVAEGTANVLIESAQFDPVTTRYTSRKLQLMSESNFRFERGVDPVALDEASLRACQLIIQTGGGELAAGVVDVWARPYKAPKVTLRCERTNKLLGMDVPADRQEEILGSLGLGPRRKARRIVCTIPPYRPDLRREIDLIEEVARLEGYSRIGMHEKVTHAVNPECSTQAARRQVCEALAAGGFDEAVTPPFVDADEATLFDETRPICVDAMVRKTNNALRTSLLPSLLRVCKSNQDRGNADVSLFEMASVFRSSPVPVPKAPRAGAATKGALPDEFVQLALATTRELRELRGALEVLVERIEPEARLEVRAARVPGLDGGAAAELLLDGEIVGALGCVDAAVQDRYGLEQTIATATLRFDVLEKRAGKVRRYRPVPRFPTVRRDLSIIVDEAATWQGLSEAIRAVDQPLRVGLEYVTTYRGKPIPDGRKSVTVTLSYRWDAGTLRSEQVDELLAQVVTALGEKLSAELRR